MRVEMDVGVIGAVLYLCAQLELQSIHRDDQSREVILLA
jgi:hypothetical protein